MTRPSMFALVMVAAAIGCSKNDDTPAPAVPAATTYRGVLAGPGAEQGTVSFTISESAPQTAPSRATPLGIEAVSHTHPVSGTLRVVGNSAVSVVGTYDTHTTALSVTGGGYVAQGTVTGGVLNGTYTAGTTGNFVAVVPASGAAAFCGTWTATAGTVGNGILGVLIDGIHITGIARHDYDGHVDVVTGTLSGTDVIWAFEGYSATGTSGGAAASGSYTTTLQGGGAGTWQTASAGF